MAVSVFATVVTALANPREWEAAIAALIILIPFGLIVAIPLGLVTLLLGRPILVGVYGVLSENWPRQSVPLAGASVSLFPFTALCLFAWDDFDLFASSSASLVTTLILGALVGAVMAHWVLRAESEAPS